MAWIRLRLTILLLIPVSAMAQTETIELENGDKVTGTIVERTDEKIVLTHDVLGRIEIPLAEVKPEEPPDPGLFGVGFLAGWTRTVSLGISGQQSNINTTKIISALDADFKDDTRRWAFDARYNFSASDGDTTQNNAMTALERDFLFADSSWFAFARGRFDYDQLRSWRFRLQGEGGFGYEFITRETFELRGRTGPSIAQEWNANQFRAEWMVGPAFLWKLTGTQKLEASNYFYYAFTPSAEYRNVSDLHWQWNLVEKPALSLKAGLVNEYQSDVAPGSEKNDLKYYTSVGLDF